MRVAPQNLGRAYVRSRQDLRTLAGGTCSQAITGVFARLQSCDVIRSTLALVEFPV